MTTELERSKERSQTFQDFRKTPEVAQWLELAVKGGKFEVGTDGEVTISGTRDVRFGPVLLLD